MRIQYLVLQCFVLLCSAVTLPAQQHGYVRGILGNSHAQEASGTSWQPASSPVHALHKQHRDWRFMLHGFAHGIVNHEGGPRGDTKAFSTNMLMGSAQRDGEKITVAARAMISLEPITVGKKGYPLLLQTGETADGITPLIDRQHPHDLVMELAGMASFHPTQDHSTFLYLGFPGDPALGPPVFKHRTSSYGNPLAPITHHWLDSTHITFGVVTAGCIINNKVKLEVSVFNGREPDHKRFGFDKPRLNSISSRVTVNPTDSISLQVSAGHLHSPEQLHPATNTNRVTVSTAYNYAWHRNNFQTLCAWGRNSNKPGHCLNALLIESAVTLRSRHTLFNRFEFAEKDELFLETSPLDNTVFNVYKLQVGYLYEFITTGNIRWGIGTSASWSFVPPAIQSHYSSAPFSYLVFMRASLVDL